ncbi:DMT family transporter [Nesterenkonia sp. CL21]|uniref:DMT family transporter n=1 Tax=Nesterenkonia sp. CL21 TaxID=3064894 RepID=UPI00287ADD42|nr:DMT family transporter [Nesterenkonia sp. CL21]MDS2173040.1 DMT family transporter [Nesterenkonia sp. CL21]
MVTPLKGTLLLLAGTFALGGTSLLISTIAADPLVIASLRCLLAVPMLLPLALWELRRVDRAASLPLRTVVGALVAGLALGIDYSFWNTSIGLVGPGIATVLLNIQLVALPLIAWLVERARPMPQLAAIIPLMLTGVAMTAGTFDVGGVQLGGVLAGLAAGTAYAIYLAVIRRTAPATTKPAPFTVLALVCLSAGAAAGVGAVITGGAHWPAEPGTWGQLLALAFVGQVVVFWCLNVGMTGISETATSTLLLLPGVFALGLSSVLLRETPSPIQLTGCAVIILGAWWASLASHRRRRGRESSAVDRR